METNLCTIVRSVPLSHRPLITERSPPRPYPGGHSPTLFFSRLSVILFTVSSTPVRQHHSL